MAFDFKKEYKEFYLPKCAPQIVTVPKANYIAVRGQGDPNEEGGAYKAAVGILYAAAYTIKMSKLGDRRSASSSSGRRFSISDVDEGRSVMRRLYSLHSVQTHKGCE